MTDVHGCRICIVDDHEATLAALRELLREDGFDNVLTTSAPAPMLEAVEASDVDLVILDLRLEDADGLQLLGEIERRRDPRAFLPVLMLTAQASPVVRRRALQAGATDFVLKPFDTVEVLLRIRNLLETRALQVELEGHRRGLEDELRRHREEAARREAALAERRSRIERALAPDAIRMVFQPVFDLAAGELLGVESLTRFEVDPRRPPDEWFVEAAAVGLANELELASAQAAVSSLASLPDGAFLAVNVSPEVASTPALSNVLESAGKDLDRVVIELTEHAPVFDYEGLNSSMRSLRSAGARLAIDDAGAGYATFQHILRLRPDFIKLDLGLTRGIDGDPVRRSLAAALVRFGEEIGALLIAEGVERREELAVLSDLGFAAAQGYFLGRPEPLPVATTMLEVWP
jgi:EAL domain-containing protein (putative c-di-GMP-specific phosphodiesterase class I)/ActR/RegA family two-component response regulator